MKHQLTLLFVLFAGLTFAQSNVLECPAVHKGNVVNAGVKIVIAEINTGIDSVVSSTTHNDCMISYNAINQPYNYDRILELVRR